MNVNNTKNQSVSGQESVEKLRENHNEAYDFNSSLQPLWKKIGSHNVMTLSTCSDNHVTSRQMSVVVINGRFYCQTGDDFLKYRQILQNNNVALCTKNFSIEGECRDIGKPLDESNILVAKAIKKYFLLAYKSYSHLESERLLEITPSLIYSWSYEGFKPYMEFWNFQDLTYHKEYK
ncbi:MAG: pyridoxamine 5'-phosphate oxidase family protein [Eubacterium sp.]|nr:pyridoxamine 5'-phosphate oxidase family protein [Eubacterium sp.]